MYRFWIQAIPVAVNTTITVTMIPVAVAAIITSIRTNMIQRKLTVKKKKVSLFCWALRFWREALR